MVGAGSIEHPYTMRIALKWLFSAKYVKQNVKLQNFTTQIRSLHQAAIKKSSDVINVAYVKWTACAASSFAMAWYFTSFL